MVSANAPVNSQASTALINLVLSTAMEMECVNKAPASVKTDFSA